MEKYGVSETSKKEGKTASNPLVVCPDCGIPLEDQERTGVSKCPKCGTKPFESAR